jgi:hypothetical protein
VIADQAFASDARVRSLESRGAAAVLPSKKDRGVARD